MQQVIIGVVVILAIPLSLWLLARLMKGIRPSTKKEIIQNRVDKLAAGSDYERARGLGKSCSGGGWLGVIALIIVGLLVFDAIMMNGDLLRNIMNGDLLGRIEKWMFATF